MTLFICGFTLILTEALSGQCLMINLRIPPKNPEELYEFFMHIANPTVNSKVSYIGGIQYFREDWVIDAYLSKSGDLYGLWFRYKESDSAKWYDVYEKFKI